MLASLEESIRRGWAVLAPPKSNHFTTYPLAVSQDLTPRLALDRAGRRHLLIPTDEVHELSGESSASLSLTVSTLVFDGEALQYLAVCCNEPELNPEFDEVLVDIMDAVSRHPEDAGSVTLDVVGRWRRLFRAAGKRGLSPEAQMGLFAELSLLRALQDIDDRALSFWTGPEAAPHDFELPFSSVEVKGVGRTADHIVVHGLDQMDSMGGKPLTLALVFLGSHPAGETVAGLISALEAVVEDVPAFRAKLRGSGWTGQEPDSRFVIDEIRRVDVIDVPRLVGSDLRSGTLRTGIYKLSYSVSLAEMIPRSSLSTLERVAAECLS